MEDALSKDVLDDETVKNLLGDDLYKEYLREKSGQNYLGSVHARMRERQGNARCVAGCFVVSMYVCLSLSSCAQKVVWTFIHLQKRITDMFWNMFKTFATTADSRQLAHAQEAACALHTNIRILSDVVKVTEELTHE